MHSLVKLTRNFAPQPADFSKRVMVVGGRVSGLEATGLPFAKGHGVTLFSSSPELGGGLLLSLNYQDARKCGVLLSTKFFLEKYGVEYVLNYKVSARDIVDFMAMWSCYAPELTIVCLVIWRGGTSALRANIQSSQEI